MRLVKGWYGYRRAYEECIPGMEDGYMGCLIDNMMLSFCYLIMGLAVFVFASFIYFNLPRLPPGTTMVPATEQEQPVAEAATVRKSTRQRKPKILQ
jgi:hypothetical protein